MDKLFSNILFFLVLAFFVPNAKLIAQMSMLKFKKFDIDDGLSSNEVRRVMQDSDGFIWILTFDGINRYDGYEFKGFQNDSHDSCSISQAVPFSIVEGIDFIWMGTSNGILNKYNKETGCFKKYKVYNENKLWSHGIWNLIAEGDSLIWLSTERGLVRFNAQTEKFTVFQPTIMDSNEFTVLEDVMYNINKDVNEDNKILIGTRGGVIVFDKKMKAFSRFNTFKSKRVITDIYQENDSIIWLTAQNLGIVKINRIDSNYSIFYSRSKLKKFNTTEFIKKKDKDEYWVSFFDYGLSIFNLKDKHFTFFSDIRNDFANFPVKNCEHIYNTNDGSLWLSSVDGLYLSKKKNKIFKHYFINDENSNRPIFFFVNDLIEIADSAYILTMNQIHYLLYLNKESGTAIDTFFLDENIWFRHLIKDNEGKIWLTSSKGLFQIDIQNRKIVRPKLKSDIDFSKHWLSKIIKDEEGNIFILDISLPGLIRLDTKQKSAVVISKFFQDNKIESLRNLRSIGNDELLIISDPYPIIYNYMTEEFKIVESKNKKISLSHEWLNCGIENNNDLFFGYGGNGIYVFNRKSNSVKVINKEKGLLSNGILQFEKDKHGDIWIGSSGGLNVVSKDNYDILAEFTEDDGLIKNNLGILWTSAFKSLESGDMMIGGHGFFTIYNPDSLLGINEQSFNLKFESLSVNSKEKVFDKVLYRKSKINLESQDNSFTIKFANLNFNRKSKERYKYRLNGYDENWNYTSNNFFSYSKVPPGDYRLELSIDKDDYIKSIDINIAPEWWQTWWFKTLFLLFNLGVLFFLYNKRITYIREKERLKAQFNNDLLETEMKMLQSQMNSHFLFNTLNSIKNYIIKNETRLAVSYLNSFAILIRKILNNSEFKFISLSNELETIRLYLDLEMMRFEDRFNYDIQIDDSIDKDNIKVPPLLLQPFIENAIWHGLLHKEEKGKITIEVKKDQDIIYYTITDNGIGREKALSIKSKSALEKKNYGLRLSKERLETLKNIYDLEIDFEISDMFNSSGEPFGTRVIVIFKGLSGIK